MKKQNKYFLIGLLAFLILMPINAYATNVDLSLSCDKSVKKEAVVTCTLKANITEGSLSRINGTISATDAYLIPATQNFSENTGWEEESNITLKTFTLAAKSNIGVANIRISNLEGEDDASNPVTFSKDTLSTEVKILDDNNKLTDLKIDGISINNFSDKNYSYTESINKENITITASKPESAISVTGVGPKKLVCGLNNFKITVTAEDSSKRTYSLNLNRSCNNDKTLKMITLSSGALTPTFSPDTKEYKVNVSTDIAKMSISVEKANNRQTVNGEVKDAALQYGANKFDIIVTSELGESETYSVIINRQDGRNTNNDLTSIILNDGNNRLKPEFSKEITEYTTKVLYETKSISVEAQAESQTSKIQVIGGNNLKVGDNLITIKVANEKNEIKEYKIIVTRLKEGETLGDNPDIKNIYVEGYNIDFSSSTTEYFLKIEDEKELKIEVTMEDPSSTYIITGNEDLKDESVITINTTSLDGTTKTYKIKIEKDSLTLVLIIAGVSILVALALIVYLIVKSKKKKINNQVVTTTVIKQKDNKDTNKDEDLMKKVEQQLKMAEQKNDIQQKPVNNTKPQEESTINSSNTEQEKNIFNELRINEDSFQEDPSQNNYKVENNQEEVIDTLESDETSTKICSICGHRVLASAKTCPYCRRTW